MSSPAAPAAPLVSPLVILHEAAALAIRHARNGRRRLVGSSAVRFTNVAKGVSRLRLLLVSLDRRRRSTFSTARVTASRSSGRARRSTGLGSRPATVRRWSPLKARSDCFWGVDNDGSLNARQHFWIDVRGIGRDGVHAIPRRLIPPARDTTSLRPPRAVDVAWADGCIIGEAGWTTVTTAPFDNSLAHRTFPETPVQAVRIAPSSRSPNVTKPSRWSCSA